MVSIADKLDTLRECFRIGLIPTSSKDPFALRRAAQGIIKILFEGKLPVPFDWLVGDVAQLREFLLERVQYYLRDIKSFAYDEVNAVLAPPITTLHDLEQRADAIHHVRPTTDFEPLAASFKRIKNILRQADMTGSAPPSAALIAPGPEQELYQAFEKLRAELARTADYRDKLAAAATLRPHVDLFFDKILVNDPDARIRQNRLALLGSLLTEFSTIADFSEIVTEGV